MEKQLLRGVVNPDFRVNLFLSSVQKEMSVYCKNRGPHLHATTNRFHSLTLDSFLNQAFKKTNKKTTKTFLYNELVWNNWVIFKTIVHKIDQSEKFINATL